MKAVHLTLSNAIGATAMIGFIGLSAWADTPPPPPPPPPSAAVGAACKQDMHALCPDVKPGDGRVAACIKTNYRLLSPGCKEAIRENRQERMHPPVVTPPPPAGTPPPPPPPPPPPGK